MELNPNKTTKVFPFLMRMYIIKCIGRNNALCTCRGIAKVSLVSQPMNPPTFPQVRTESLIGTAVCANTFILIETPQPWLKPALLSETVPESLRQVLKPLLGPASGVRIHLIANEQTTRQSRRRILIFQHAASSLRESSMQGLGHRLSGDYKAWEIQVETPAEMASALSEFLGNTSPVKRIPPQRIRSAQRHLMICTHASHNECCGTYGYPFYRKAIAHINQLELSQQIQAWQISHIGGHRFAPTLIDFPQGRYYGNLDETSLLSLLRQEGAIDPVISTYRGWSVLPKPLQILEAELFRQHGWSWLKGQVASKVLAQNEERKHYRVELWFESAEHQLFRYTAEIQNNAIQNYQLDSELSA